MDKIRLKTRGDVIPGKKQVNWRIAVKVFNALQADAGKRGFSSVPALLNHLLTLYYFGDMKNKIDLSVALTCKRCQHRWYPRITTLPKRCPQCQSPYWNKERRNA